MNTSSSSMEAFDETVNDTTTREQIASVLYSKINPEDNKYSEALAALELLLGEYENELNLIAKTQDIDISFIKNDHRSKLEAMSQVTNVCCTSGVKPKLRPTSEDAINKAPKLEGNILDFINEDLVYNKHFPNLFPKGNRTMMLYGPPGTGKTFVINSIAKYLRENDEKYGPRIWSASGSSVKSKFLGETEKNLKSFFTVVNNYVEDNKGSMPSILFIDEFESLARDRKESKGDAASSSTVTSLLQLLDGIESYKNVYTIVATNRPWEIDSAILSRFSRRYMVDLPHRNSRYKYIKNKFRERCVGSKELINCLSIENSKISDLVLNGSDSDKGIHICEYTESLIRLLTDLTGPVQFEGTSEKTIETSRQNCKEALQIKITQDGKPYFAPKNLDSRAKNARHAGTPGYSYRDMDNVIRLATNRLAKIQLRSTFSTRKCKIGSENCVSDEPLYLDELRQRCPSVVYGCFIDAVKNNAPITPIGEYTELIAYNQYNRYYPQKYC